MYAAAAAAATGVWRAAAAATMVAASCGAARTIQIHAAPAYTLMRIVRPARNAKHVRHDAPTAAQHRAEERLDLLQAGGHEVHEHDARARRVRGTRVAVLHSHESRGGSARAAARNSGSYTRTCASHKLRVRLHAARAHAGTRESRREQQPPVAAAQVEQRIAVAQRGEPQGRGDRVVRSGVERR